MLATSMIVACAALAKLDAASLPNQTTVISSARINAATAATASSPASPALPEHCEVVGKLNERIGFNSQVEALVAMFDGPKDSQGRPTYASWPWDTGIGHEAGMNDAMSWRSWKMGPYNAKENSGHYLAFISSSAAAIFATPPVPRATHGPDLAKYAMETSVDDHVARAAASGGIYRESADSFMKADSTDIARFAARGGKIIVVHGVSDAIFSVNDSIAWWKGVDAAQSGKAAGTVRLFAVPGMAHCIGGPATDQFDAFSALVDWVEKNAAPDRIIAKARPSSPWPGRTRPLCAYPAQARYKGTGSIEDAENFVCK